MTAPRQDPKEPLEELPEQECWLLLGQKQLGRLAVSINHAPDVFPVNYVVDDESIVVRTAPGLKLAAAVSGTAVAFEVDAIDERHRRGWSVVVRGRAVEIERLDELLEAELLPIEPWAGGRKSRYLRIEPTAITGRRLP